MAERLIWKLGMTRDFLKSLPDEEIVNELIKMGVDEEMLGQLDHEGLIGLLDDIDDLDDEDLKDFDLKIVPMIRNQTGDSGMVMMVSSDRVIPAYAETLVDGIYPLSYLEGEIIDDGRGLTLRADDGVEYKLYAIPDDSIDFMNFVNECLPDFIPDNVNDLMASDDYLDDDMAYNEVINNLPQLIDDEDVIKDYAYIPAFEDNRKRIDNELTTNESLGESMSDLEKLDSFLGIDDVDESLTEDVGEVYTFDRKVETDNKLPDSGGYKVTLVDPIHNISFNLYWYKNNSYMASSPDYINLDCNDSTLSDKLFDKISNFEADYNCWIELRKSITDCLPEGSKVKFKPIEVIQPKTLVRYSRNGYRYEYPNPHYKGSDVDESLTEALSFEKFEKVLTSPNIKADIPDMEFSDRLGDIFYNELKRCNKKAFKLYDDGYIDSYVEVYDDLDAEGKQKVTDFIVDHIIIPKNESLTEAGFFDKLTGKGNPPVTAILRIKHFNEYTNGAKGLPKVRSLFTRSRNGSSVLHEVAYYIYDLDQDSYEISSRNKLGDKEFEKQNAKFLKAVKDGENRQFEYLDADKLLAEKNKKDADDIAEVEKARKEGEKEAQLKKEYADREAQQKARNDADDKKSRDRFTSKQAARNNQTTYNSTKDEYYESLEEAKKKVVATVTYTYDGSDRAYSDDEDAYKYWCEEIECRPSSLKKKGIGKGDKFTADIVQYDEDEDDVGIINIKKVIDESLNEDADEYYVLAISDRGGNSDYIKGPMTKEEATEYAKISRKNASKYYREKYLVYPKNRIPGRYKHLLDNESLQESISLDQADREKLVDELSQIKSMDKNKLYNIDLLTTDLSDGSVEELFPVTTKLIVSFLSEMANITKEELADKDQINIWWTDGDLFDDRDWEALFNGADKLINGKKRVLWKVYYSPYLDEDLNSDVYDALSDVAYDYEVNKLEPVYVDDFEEAEKNFNDKFFDGLTRDDYDESLNESLSNELQNKIKEICDIMIANLEKEDLEYIIEEPPYSEDGILSNDDLADLDGDESEIAEFAINYIKSKI